jgi:hypothetical protein
MPPSYLVCPTAVVEAPVETVWQLLTYFAGWGDFYDVRVLSVEPPGPAVVGQRMRGESGPRWLRLGICFEHTLVDNAHHKLEFEGRLPLGLTVHESLDCVPLDSQRCRVNYHCHFGFPDTWRGKLLRVVLGRAIADGPADSLARLKRAAEARAKDGLSDSQSDNLRRDG